MPHGSFVMYVLHFDTQVTGIRIMVLAVIQHASKALSRPPPLHFVVSILEPSIHTTRMLAHI